MDLGSMEHRLEAGEQLKIKYRYPKDGSEIGYGIRSDRLLDVSVELKRLYTNFRGETPIWLNIDEVIEITPDDGVYEEFPE